MPTTQTLSRCLAVPLLAAALASGCHDDSNTITGVRASTPTPAPLDLSGDWKGSFTTNDPADCASGDAELQLTQTADHVTGTLRRIVDSCGVGGSLDGIAVRGNLQATLSPGGDFSPGNVAGAASASEMQLKVNDMHAPGGDFIPGGYLNLHR